MVRLRRIWMLALAMAMLGAGCACAQSASAGRRQVRLIDAGWRFTLGDHRGAEAVAFDDAQWQPVGLPHSFGIPYFGSAKFYVGYGWYRKHLQVAGSVAGRRESLEFEAAFQDAEVWVNGKRVGGHQGGYTGFSLDATGAIKTGDNVIAVRLNNRWNATLNPRAGEHTFNGGIYRNVYLVTTDDLHVAWYGTFITTPDLRSPDGSPVHVETELRNDSQVARRFTLRTDVLDANGRQVATTTSDSSIAAGSALTLQQDTGFVPKPALWSPAHPAMYTAVTHVTANGRELDRYETPFGFRWIKWTSEEGFFLNGGRYYFHGADVHQDHAGWGDGVTNAGITRDVRLVKGAGMDFIRGSHYPHSPVFADECDRQGLLFWEENSFWGTGGAKVEGGWTASGYPPHEADQGPFEASVERSLAEMIRINRNHPSIIAWSMGNEMYFSDADLLPKIRVFLKKLVEETHGLDPTRPAAIGGVQRGDIDKIGDVAGYNGDGALEFLDPGVANVVSEYGSTMTDRPGKYEPGFGALANQPQFPWRSGQALWCAFDHGSIFIGMGTMGMIDYFRLPKRMWYWYRNAYLNIPPPEWPVAGTAVSLALTADDDAQLHADGTGDVQVVVTVRGADGRQVSSAPPVKLEIVSGPGEFPTGRSIDFAADSDIAIRDGEAAIELRAYQSGTIRLKASSPGLKDAELMVQATGAPAFIAGTTPVVAPRPYVRLAEAVPVPTVPVDLSSNRPVASSSSAPGHGSRSADDADPATFWQPGASGPAWWQVDLEGRCRLQTVTVTLAFAVAERPRYAIQVSDDGAAWRTVIEHRSGDAEIPLPEGTSGRFVRVVFEAAVVQLAEVKVLGHPL